MTSLEQTIMTEISKLNIEHQQRVLDYIRSFDRAPEKHSYTAHDLMQMPVAERERLVNEAFDLAAQIDFEIFEAYDEETPDDSSY